ncbi:MAG: hypothetical protein DRH30_02630 [Deltaproteobacteria bacterium]|nr:MAG: hypothetical protein DRH30_02630 [Deltaproteobacteria bacterium]
MVLADHNPRCFRTRFWKNQDQEESSHEQASSNEQEPSKMSYKNPNAKASSISVGSRARHDPLMAFTSVMASKLMLLTTKQPKAKRLGWIRNEMNKTNLGFGDDMVTKYRELSRRGVGQNQALFDAIRSTIANRVATYVDKHTEKHSVAGLGDTASDVRLAMCTGFGIGAGAGGTVGAAIGDPAMSTAITASMQAGANIQGCGQEQLDAQVALAEANARTAEANASMGPVEGADNTMMYVAAGGGIIVLGLLGVLILKK